MKDIILIVHVLFAVFGMFCAIWLFVEALNASESNRGRMKLASALVALFMLITWIVSGYGYVLYYAADKAIILAGPWAFAHTIVMESKEHVFFITLVLSLLLPVVVFTQDLVANGTVRRLTLWILALIVLSALALEGAGSLIALAVKLGLMQTI